jgi:hypothetical protein
MAENVALLTMPLLRFLSVTGEPLAGAKLYSFEAGSAIPKALYGDPGGVAALPNPALTDASGQLLAYLISDQSYKLDLFDANDVHQPGWPIDYVQAISVQSDTFTPVVEGSVTPGVGTYLVQNGTYNRFGPIVFFRIRIVSTAHTGTGHTLIRGMPVAVQAGAIIPCLLFGNGAAFIGPIIANLNSAFPTPTIEILQHNLANRQVAYLDLQTLATGGQWEAVFTGMYLAV